MKKTLRALSYSYRIQKNELQRNTTQQKQLVNTRVAYCLFTHSIVTEQHYHLFAVIFLANLNVFFFIFALFLV